MEEKFTFPQFACHFYETGINSAYSVEFKIIFLTISLIFDILWLHIGFIPSIFALLFYSYSFTWGSHLEFHVPTMFASLCFSLSFGEYYVMYFVRFVAILFFFFSLQSFIFYSVCIKPLVRSGPPFQFQQISSSPWFHSLFSQVNTMNGFNVPDADSVAQWEATWKEFDESTNKSLPQEDIRSILLLLGKDVSASTCEWLFTFWLVFSLLGWFSFFFLFFFG